MGIWRTRDPLRHRKYNPEDMSSKTNIFVWNHISTFILPSSHFFSSKATPYHKDQQAYKVIPNQGKKRLNSAKDSLKTLMGKSLGILKLTSVSLDRKSLTVRLDYSAIQTPCR